MILLRPVKLADPTGGFVTYLTQAEAEADGLYKIEGNQVYFGVDNTQGQTGTSTGDPNCGDGGGYNGCAVLEWILAHHMGQPSTRCLFDTYFKNMNIIFDTTFCGSWAGAVWARSYCATVDASCTDYVAKNPQAYADGYRLVNSVKVYQ
ncbi:hypothetical protein MMC18_001093 [Xylographa bjoerkii]|nr:hypothetical protein [Xylographa bjoerkii]